MIKTLQRKFILITMLALISALLVVVGGINGINIYQVNKKSEILISMLAENGGNFPQQTKKDPRPQMEEKDEKTAPKEELKTENENPQEESPKEEPKKGILDYHISEETPFETRYFTVTVADASDSSKMSVNVSHIAAVSEEEAKEFTEELIQKEKTSGYYGRYRYQKAETEDGKSIYIYVDCLNDLQSIQNFAVISLLVGGIFLVLVLILVSVFSKRAIRPVVESMEKQKQFITDAGHEIKTPIAIILANTEVIEMCEGESEWTKSIKNQVSRLTELVGNLLMLSKMDETRPQIEMQEVKFGKLIKEISDSFHTMLVQKNQELERMIDEELSIYGNEKELRQLGTILMDNAVKYTPDSGKMRISLKRKDKMAVLDFYNDCEALPQGDLNRLFDRFYRADSSRSRESGGYGIGLSVAKAVVKNHKGKISVKAQENGILFTVKIPVGESSSTTKSRLLPR